MISTYSHNELQMEETCFLTFSMASCSRTTFDSRQIFFPGLELDRVRQCVQCLGAQAHMAPWGPFQSKVGRNWKGPQVQYSWLNGDIKWSERTAQDPRITNLQGMKGHSALDSCWQEGLHSLRWPLSSKTTLASGFPSKHLLSAGCWCTRVPGEHTISTPSGRHLAATGAKGKPRYK